MRSISPERARTRLDQRSGAHLCTVDGRVGTRFAVVAPNAVRASVIGDFNHWNEDASPMRRVADRWECFVPGVGAGTLYKFRIYPVSGTGVNKADPLAFAAEVPPRTASRVWDLSRYTWQDDSWMSTRGGRNGPDAPVSVYEVHLGSWMRAPQGEWLSYRESAHRLADYAAALGFTHVELLPITEHPFDGSWGYQTVAYYAPTSRYGTPDDFMYLVDTLHRAGVGVILDWVPGHFPADPHGLSWFDGTALYEHHDSRQRHHPDWGTLVSDLGKREVAEFLVDCALFWLDRYHIDGFRVDAVASMLYLDYSRRDGEWTPNAEGGNENHAAVRFLQTLNDRIRDLFPDTLVIAEESTAWPLVSHPTAAGGLGFDLKWNMGWMHDVLRFMQTPPALLGQRQKHLTASLDYASAEHFVLPLSHDEVVHGKGSLRDRMPGGEPDQYANLRLLYGWMFGHPGKKLLFMGNELGQRREWQHEATVEWELADQTLGRGLQQWVADLNRLYRAEAALHADAFDNQTFEWLDCGRQTPGVISVLRRSPARSDPLLFVYNFTSCPVVDHPIGVPRAGFWHERLNSDATVYGGRNRGNLGGRQAAPVTFAGRPARLRLQVPPLTTLVLSPDSWECQTNQ